MEDVTNQTNLDLIFETYYSTRVSQCDLDFELPEDCINMSFSELFGQELLSTEENKDCKLTIKIEDNDSLDTPNNHSLKNVEESITLSSSISKSSIPKKGINRTLIKNTDVCDIRYLINNPFCTDDLRDNQISLQPELPVIQPELKNTNNNINHNSLKVETLCSSTADFSNTIIGSPPKHQNINGKKSTNKIHDIEHFNHHPFYGSDNLVSDHLLPIEISKIKEEPDCTEENITEQNVIEKSLITPCNSVNTSQNKIDDLVFVEDEMSSSSKTSSSNYHDIKRSYVKLTDVKDLIYKSCNNKNVKNNQVPLKTKKCKRALVNKNVDTGTLTYYPGNDSHELLTTDSHESARIQVVEKNCLLSQPDNIIQQRNGINYVSVKPIKNYDIEQLLVHELLSVKATSSDVKNTHIDFNLDHTPCFSADKSQNTTVNHSDILSSVSNAVLVDPKNGGESSNKIIKGHIVKDLNNKPYDKVHDLDIIKKNDVESSLSKTSPTRYKVNSTFSKTTENHDGPKPLTHKHNSKSKNQNIENLLLKNKTSVIEQKASVIATDTIKQNNVKLNVVPCNSSDNAPQKNNCLNIVKKDLFTVLSESVFLKRPGAKRSIKAIKSKQQVKTRVNEVKDLNDDLTKGIKSKSYDHNVNIIVEEPLDAEKMISQESKCVVDSDDFCSTDLNNTSIEKQKVVIIKGENETFFKSDTDFQTVTVGNEKKKITWEEFRAKREKMGLIMTSDNQDFSNTATADTDELESVIQEFDRNTAVHFINKTNVTDDNEKQNISDAKEVVVTIKDLELENKRMKIEYFQKLIPTSIASELAKKASFMKGVLVEDNEIDCTSSDVSVYSGKTRSNSCNSQEDLDFFKQDEKYGRKNNRTRNSSSHSSTSRSDYSTKNGQSPILASLDDYYNCNKNDGIKEHNKSVKRIKHQNRVVYVGQIPIDLGKTYLYNRFKQFGSVLSITLHKKPDFRVYYAFVTYYNEKEADRAINRGNDDKTQVQLDIRYGERKQTQTPYYDLDDEWLTDWYGYNNQPLAVVRPPQSPEKAVSFEQELKEFHKLAQIKKSTKSSQIS